MLDCFPRVTILTGCKGEIVLQVSQRLLQAQSEEDGTNVGREGDEEPVKASFCRPTLSHTHSSEEPCSANVFHRHQWLASSSTKGRKPNKNVWCKLQSITFFHFIPRTLSCRNRKLVSSIVILSSTSGVFFTIVN